MIKGWKHNEEVKMVIVGSPRGSVFQILTVLEGVVDWLMMW